MPPGPGFLRLLRVLPLLLAPGPRVSAEISSKPEDYEFGDYRGKWCLDESGYVYAIGQVYSPSPFACPCTCTEDGPLCVRPTCPRVHPRCTRIRYKGCCPVCEAMARVCVYGGRTYRPLEEFWVSRCEHCRCGANREVYCSISDCPAPHCVNPTYQPHHCCPICTTGPNCFVGSRIIEAGERVIVDDTVCFCTYREGSWHTLPYATCEEQQLNTELPEAHRDQDSSQDSGQDSGQGRGYSPRLHLIP